MRVYIEGLRWGTLKKLSCLVGIILIVGCSGAVSKLAEEVTPGSNITATSKVDFSNYEVKRIAVIPFQNESEDADAGFKVASYFYQQLSTHHKEYQVSPPLKIKGEGMRMEFLRPRLKGSSERGPIKTESKGENGVKKGSTPSPEEQFDAVVTGRIIRYHDRGGNPLLTIEPASVAYEVYLISVKDGSVLWQAEYNETQQPLDENLLLLDRYFKNGFWWWSSDQMTNVGMERVIKTFPGIKMQGSSTSDESRFYLEEE